MHQRSCIHKYTIVLCPSPHIKKTCLQNNTSTIFLCAVQSVFSKASVLLSTLPFSNVSTQDYIFNCVDVWRKLWASKIVVVWMIGINESKKVSIFKHVGLDRAKYKSALKKPSTQNIKLRWEDWFICTCDLQGYVKRQALYACGTCSTEDVEPAGVCLACTLTCHDGHMLYELYTKRWLLTLGVLSG